MNKYVKSVIENVKKKHAHEPEFCQTVEEVLSSISPIVDQHPEYEKVDLLNRLVEPERMFTFRVTWMDDKGKWHTNTGYKTLSSFYRQPSRGERWIYRSDACTRGINSRYSRQHHESLQTSAAGSIETSLEPGSSSSLSR